MLNPDPAKRLTAEQALMHPVSTQSPSSGDTQLIRPPCPQWLTTQASTEHDLTGLRDNFNPRARWRAAIAGARALHRFGSSQSGKSSSSKSSGGWKTVDDLDADDSDEEEAPASIGQQQAGDVLVKVTAPEDEKPTQSNESPDATTPQQSKPPSVNGVQPAEKQVAPSTQHELKREEEGHAPLHQEVPKQVHEQAHPKAEAKAPALAPAPVPQVASLANGKHADGDHDHESELDMPGSFNARPSMMFENGHDQYQHSHHGWIDFFKKMRIHA